MVHLFRGHHTSLSNSPWMRGAPHVGFSTTMRKIRSRTSLLEGFLPAARQSATAKTSTTEIQAMPTHHRFWGHEQERFLLPRPQLLERDPKHHVDRAQLPPRSFGMESQQLLTQGQILQHEVLVASKCADKPADEVPKQRNHGKNLSFRPAYEFATSSSFYGLPEFWRTTAKDSPMPGNYDSPAALCGTMVLVTSGENVNSYRRFRQE